MYFFRYYITGSDIGGLEVDMGNLGGATTQIWKQPRKFLYVKQMYLLELITLADFL